MALSPSSDDDALRFWTSRGVALSGPLEWQPLWLEVPADPMTWERVSVTIGARPVPTGLRLLAGTPRVVAEWPRAGAGLFTVTIVTDGARVAHVVRVPPAKLSATDVACLFEALEIGLPASIALALQQAGAAIGVEDAPFRPTTLAEEVARLRRAVEGGGDHPGLVALLPAIDRAPHIALVTTEEWTPRARVRQPVVSQLAHAFAQASNRDSAGGVRELIDQRADGTTDVYENRIVRTFVAQVDRRLRRLERLVAAAPTLGGGTLGAEVLALRTRLNRAQRTAQFLDGVQELSTPPNQVTMVLLRLPAYRAALNAFLAFQRGLAAQLDRPLPDAPLNALPTLYQAWGTLHVVLATLSVARAAGYVVQHQRLVGRDLRGTFVRALPVGVPAVVFTHPDTGARVRVVPEQTYGSESHHADGLRALSFAQRPDVAVEILHPTQPARLLLFDPKYKLSDPPTNVRAEPLRDELLDDSHASDTLPAHGQPLKTDIDKMHTYRDAIRDRSGSTVVTFAAILYPGDTRTFDQGIAALGARPAQSAKFEQELRAILSDALAVPFSPGSTPSTSAEV